jgi:hypothetical protein
MPSPKRPKGACALASVHRFWAHQLCPHTCACACLLAPCAWLCSVAVKPAMVKNHLFVFVNALIVNPSFDTQTKVTLTTQKKDFGSDCVLSDNTIKRGPFHPLHALANAAPDLLRAVRLCVCAHVQCVRARSWRTCWSWRSTRPRKR